MSKNNNNKNKINKKENNELNRNAKIYYYTVYVLVAW